MQVRLTPSPSSALPPLHGRGGCDKGREVVRFSRLEFAQRVAEGQHAAEPHEHEGHDDPEGEAVGCALHLLLVALLAGDSEAPSDEYLEHDLTVAGGEGVRNGSHGRSCKGGCVSVGFLSWGPAVPRAPAASGLSP